MVAVLYAFTLLPFAILYSIPVHLMYALPSAVIIYFFAIKDLARTVFEFSRRENLGRVVERSLLTYGAVLAVLNGLSVF
jgi:hypothetical protein